VTAGASYHQNLNGNGHRLGNRCLGNPQSLFGLKGHESLALAKVAVIKLDGVGIDTLVANNLASRFDAKFDILNLRIY
jgi:hypothetical protein